MALFYFLSHIESGEQIPHRKPRRYTLNLTRIAFSLPERPTSPSPPQSFLLSGHLSLSGILH